MSKLVNRPNRLTIEIVRERYKDSNLKLLSTAYKNNHTHLQWKCKTCGYEFPRSLGKIQASEACDSCNGRLPITIESINEYLKDKPLTLLSTEYKDNSSYLDFKCDVCNFEFPRSWAKLRESHSCPDCNNYKRRTIEDVEEFVKDKPIKLLSTEYVNQDSDLEWECKLCGHTYAKSYSIMKDHNKCEMCEGHGSDFLEIIKQRFRKRDRNAKVLSTEYVDKKTPLVLQCTALKCKNVWEASYYDFMSGKNICKEHYAKEYSLPIIKDTLKRDNRNIELLSTEYKDSNTRMYWKCALCGHKWKTTTSSVLGSGSGCSNCAKNKSYNITSIKEKLVTENIPLQYVSGNYKNKNSILNWKCLNPKCNKVFPKSWGKILHRDKGCLFCKPKGRSTSNKTIVNRDKEFYLSQKCFVYVIKCEDEYESFYKIGYTKNDPKERIASYPYNCTTIKIVETNRYDAVYIESDLHEFHREYAYQPKKKFGGYRECFSQIHIKE